jgi:integrase
MASIEYRSRTTRIIAYVDREKHSFPLGKVTRKTAERFANNIDRLLHEHRCNVPLSREVTNWLADLGDSLYDLLIERGLAEPRQAVNTLCQFIDVYIETRFDVTERRRDKFRMAKKRMIEFFGDRELSEITAGDADEYARWLSEEVAPATAQKECQIAAQFLRHAQRKELIDRNPFDGVTAGRATNDDRRVFVSEDVIMKVIDACPNWEWRTVTALARFGGLRCSSEVALLKWSDILWDENRFIVTSPKTARYGKGQRTVPLFPNLRRFLDEAFQMAPEGCTWVVPMLEGLGSKNLGTTFKKIIRRAGVDAWPKPFQNLRSSLQTELEQQWPTYVVCKWIGNTPEIANKHYLTVTDEHFEMAAATDTENRDEIWGQTGDKRGTQPPATPRTALQKKSQFVINARENTCFSDIVGILENTLVAEEGLEKSAFHSVNIGSPC